MMCDINYLLEKLSNHRLAYVDKKLRPSRKARETVQSNKDMIRVEEPRFVEFKKISIVNEDDDVKLKEEEKVVTKKIKDHPKTDKVGLSAIIEEKKAILNKISLIKKKKSYKEVLQKLTNYCESEYGSKKILIDHNNYEMFDKMKDLKDELKGSVRYNVEMEESKIREINDSLLEDLKNMTVIAEHRNDLDQWCKVKAGLQTNRQKYNLEKRKLLKKVGRFDFNILQSVSRIESHKKGNNDVKVTIECDKNQRIMSAISDLLLIREMQRIKKENWKQRIVKKVLIKSEDREFDQVDLGKKEEKPKVLSDNIIEMKTQKDEAESSEDNDDHMKKMCMDIETLKRDQNVLKKQIACCSNRDEKVELGKRIVKIGSELKILISKKERIENERWLASLQPQIRMYL